MKKWLRNSVSLFVLAVFAFYLVPHEVVHIFYDHEDTMHEEQHSGSTALSSIHVHCDFLSTDLNDFVSADELIAPVVLAVVNFKYTICATDRIASTIVAADSRGPPASL